MATTIAQVLAFDVVQDAQPKVLAGSERLQRNVRWVHSSEIYEIAPLLSGGELLLTSGLGLAGKNVTSRRRYIRSLAQRDVAGLCIEVGRTLAKVPDDMIDEANRHKLPLVGFYAVVPFVRISEAVNTVLADVSARSLRLGDSVTRALNDGIISGASLSGLLDVAARMTGTSLVVVAPNDTVVASSGVEDEHAARQVVDKPLAEAEVVLNGQRWGRLLAGGSSPLDVFELQTALDRAAVAVALAGLRAGVGPQVRRDVQSGLLLAELIEDRSVKEPDVAMRARMVGFHTDPQHWLVGVALSTERHPVATTVIDQAARLLGLGALHGQVGRYEVAVLAVSPSQIDPVGIVRHVLSEAALRVAGRQIRVGVGSASDGAGGLTASSSSLREAIETLELSTRIASYTGAAFPPVVVARDVQLERMLMARYEPFELALTASAVLGPVIEWDRKHGSDLVRTVEVHLRNGAKATRTASQLRLGRQSLYQRIARIESLLGYDLDSPELHTSLLIASCAVRLRDVSGSTDLRP